MIWGGAFLFIGVAVRHVEPLTYVWLRLTIAAGAMWLFEVSSGKLGLPREVWGSILLLALLNNTPCPSPCSAGSQTHIASGLASILNATTPIWGVLVAHLYAGQERMTPRKIAGVLLGFGGVATMIGPTLLRRRHGCACPAGLHRHARLCPGRSLGCGASSAAGLSPMSVTWPTEAGALMMLPWRARRPALTQPLCPLRLGRDRALADDAPLSATSFISG